MVDRATAYAGQVPLETDVLKAGQFSMVGIAKLSETVLGVGNFVSGFTLSQTGLSNLVAILGPGIVYQQENLEQSAWSSMPAVTNSIEKQGILLNPVNLTFTPPGTAGQSQCFLVEVQYSDIDTGSLVLPYYNAAAPAVPFSGPGGAGTAQNTIRQGAVAYQVKAGTAATSGTQTVPTPDAGWIGLFVVTLAAGATSVNTANIAQYSLAPFLLTTLPNVPIGVQSGQWEYGIDTGAVNAAVVALVPVPPSLPTGMEILIKIVATNTGAVTLNVNGLGAKPVIKSGGTALLASDLIIGNYIPLIYDGANWRVNGLVASDITAGANAQITVRNFGGGSFGSGGSLGPTGTTSWTVPAGITRIRVRCWGGGGGGGGSAASPGAASGGGAGAYAEGIYTVTPGQSITVTAGSAGSGGGAANTGTAGGTSSFGAICSATGGGGGPGAASGGYQSSVGQGGSPSGGNTLNIFGNPGAAGAPLAGGGGLGGAGGSGYGSSGGSATYGAGNASSIIGGGGGGGANGGVGGTGGVGIIIVDF